MTISFLFGCSTAPLTFYQINAKITASDSTKTLLLQVDAWLKERPWNNNTVDVQVEPALQRITCKELGIGTWCTPWYPLKGFLGATEGCFFFFYITVCHPNADSYGDLSPKQLYRIHENEKKWKYNSYITEIEQGTFTPLVFTTTGEMADQCLRYHSR